MKTIKTAKLRTTFQPEIKQTVTAIIDDVRERGDQAVFEWSQKFDHSNRSIFRVSETEIKEALASVDDTTLDAIKAALNNIKAFAHAQRKSLGEISAFSPMPGLTLGHKLVPVDAVCCYVPGGSYPLFSSALMLITPAKAAGVKRIAACSPVEKGTGSINKTTLAAMSLAGADEIYAAGGVQAIAAFAWGTSQIKPVDLITGPGNAYVAEAKRQCYGQCGIDFIAGPSEVLIIADNSACAETIACDLLAQ